MTESKRLYIVFFIIGLLFVSLAILVPVLHRLTLERIQAQQVEFVDFEESVFVLPDGSVLDTRNMDKIQAVIAPISEYFV